MKVFLSYCSENADLARRLASDLRSAGLEVWFDQWEIDVGELFVRSFEEGVDTASVLVVLLTRASVASRFVEQEWRRKATEERETGRLAVVPVRGEPCEVPEFLAQRSHADIWHGNYPRGFVRLLEILREQPGGADLEIPEVEAIGRDASDDMIPIVTPIAVELGRELVPIAAPDRHGASRMIAQLLPGVTGALEEEFGFPFPGFRVRECTEAHGSRSAVILIDEIPEVTCEVAPDAVLVDATVQRLAELGIQAAPHPDPAATGRIRSQIAAADRDAAATAGCGTWDAVEYLCLALHAVVRRHAARFIDMDIARRLVEAASPGAPAPAVASWSELTSVLVRLLEEGIPIRDMGRILAALSDPGTDRHDLDAMTERARHALCAEITTMFAGADGTIDVLVVDTRVEAILRAAIVRTSMGSMVNLAPQAGAEILTAVRGAFAALGPMAVDAPILVSIAEVRRLLRTLVERDFPSVHVLSRQELEPSASIRALCRIGIDPDGPAIRANDEGRPT